MHIYWSRNWVIKNPHRNLNVRKVQNVSSSILTIGLTTKSSVNKIVKRIDFDFKYLNNGQTKGRATMANKGASLHSSWTFFIDFKSFHETAMWLSQEACYASRFSIIDPCLISDSDCGQCVATRGQHKYAVQLKIFENDKLNLIKKIQFRSKRR